MLPLVQRELTSLSERKAAGCTAEWLFAGMNKGVLSQVLLAGESLQALGALVALEFEVARFDMSLEVELGAEAFATLLEHAAKPSHFKSLLGN